MANKNNRNQNNRNQANSNGNVAVAETPENANETIALQAGNNTIAVPQTVPVPTPEQLAENAEAIKVIAQSVKDTAVSETPDVDKLTEDAKEISNDVAPKVNKTLAQLRQEKIDALLKEIAFQESKLSEDSACDTLVETLNTFVDEWIATIGTEVYDKLDTQFNLTITFNKDSKNFSGAIGFKVQKVDTRATIANGATSKDKAMITKLGVWTQERLDKLNDKTKWRETTRKEILTDLPIELTESEMKLERKAFCETVKTKVNNPELFDYKIEQIIS